MFTFGFTAFGTSVVIRTDNEELRHLLDRYLMPWLPRAKPEASTAHAICVTATGAGPTLQLLNGEECVQTTGGALAAVPIIQRWLDDVIIQRQTGLGVVHAGVVAINGSAVMLPGGSHSGKSSLVAALLRRGALYLSDEYALIDGTGKVHPYPRALMLRNGTPSQVPTLPSELNAESARYPMGIRLMLSLQYNREGTWALRQVSQSEGLHIMITNTPQVLADAPWILGHFSRAVAGVGCYAGLRGDANEAAAAIFRMLGSKL